VFGCRDMVWRLSLYSYFLLMMKTAVSSANSNSLALFFADFKEITKARLAISVVFSSVAGYFLGAYELSIMSIFLLAFGGYCMVGASNAYNQVIEKDLDALMNSSISHYSYTVKEIMCRLGN